MINLNVFWKCTKVSTAGKQITHHISSILTEIDGMQKCSKSDVTFGRYAKLCKSVFHRTIWPSFQGLFLAIAITWITIQKYGASFRPRLTMACKPLLYSKILWCIFYILWCISNILLCIFKILLGIFNILWCMCNILCCIFKILWCMCNILWCIFKILWCIFYNLVLYVQNLVMYILHV